MLSPCIYFLSQLYKVLFPYTPTKDDELVLSDGDYVYVHASDSGHTGTVYMDNPLYCVIMNIHAQYMHYRVNSFLRTHA